MKQWRPISSAPRDGRIVLVAYEEDGTMMEQYPMRWNNECVNGFFPDVVGMWEAPDGSSTWNEEGGYGPTHWSYIEQ